MHELDSPALSLEKLEAGWTVGRFDALAGLGTIEHVVTTREGFDVRQARKQPRQAARDLASACRWQGVAYSRQVHGRGVVYVRDPGPAGDWDGLITDRPGLGVMVFGADCPLILVADPHEPAVGVAHASWRGTVYRIAEVLIACLCGRFGSRPDSLVAAVSPSAGPCCYEVGRDVVDMVHLGLGRSADKYLIQEDGRTRFDLWQANVDHLCRAGLTAENVHPARVCTICGSDLFPSYRRQGDAAGRFLVAIAVSDRP